MWERPELLVSKGMILNAESQTFVLDWLTNSKQIAPLLPNQINVCISSFCRKNQTGVAQSEMSFIQKRKFQIY